MILHTVYIVGYMVDDITYNYIIGYMVDDSTYSLHYRLHGR